MASPRRQIAYKVKIGDMLSGEFIRREGWEPSSVVMADGTEVSRVNLIATAVTQPEHDGSVMSVMLDDGSGRITARSFDADTPLKAVAIGTPIVVVGRIREYNNERYLVPEIVKPVDNPAWIKLRQLELNNLKAEKPTEPVQDAPVEVKPEEAPTNVLEIIDIVKKLDKGDGVDQEEVLEQLKNPKAEKAIKDLLEQGELFEIKPGRLKVLD